MIMRTYLKSIKTCVLSAWRVLLIMREIMSRLMVNSKIPQVSHGSSALEGA